MSNRIDDVKAQIADIEKERDSLDNYTRKLLQRAEKAETQLSIAKDDLASRAFDIHVLETVQEKLAASEAKSEGRLKELLRKGEEARTEWRRAENAEAELLQAQSYGATVALQLEAVQADTVALDDDSALAFRKQIDTLTTQLAAVTRELSEAQAREVKNLELFFKENSEKLRLRKERDDARDILADLVSERRGSEETEEKDQNTAMERIANGVAEKSPLKAENARLRAAIAPTPDNRRALCKAWENSAHPDMDGAAEDVLVDIAARAGVKL